MQTDKKTGQMYFFEPPPLEDKDTRLWKEFLKFHSDNPEIYDVFEKEIFRAIVDGRLNYSTQIVIEEIRWKHRNRFRISNNHAPYYARLFVERHPTYRSFFHFRKVKKD